MTFYMMSYGKFRPWVVTLGSVEKPPIDPETGEEDTSEYQKVAQYLMKWRPGEKWVPQPVCVHFEASGRKLKRTDRLFHGVVGPVFSENAISAMEPLLQQDGHVLPLQVVNSDERLFLWWVPLIEESVDWERSEKFPNGRIIKRFAFNLHKIGAAGAFRPHYPGTHKPEARGDVVVSEDFRQRWQISGLTGIEFKVA